MCRITGGIDFAARTISENVLVAMRDTLSAGGPDAAGIFMEGSVSLAHRRLSIIDLSDSGVQPMQWGKWVISFNGEIYNYQEVKRKLIATGYSFSSKTDTEVIIKAFDCWGKKAVQQFRGMFVFALWNKEENKLILCRDRLGVKPLFWYFKEDLFLFASEIKAFHEHPLFDKTLDLSGLPHYLQKGYFKENDCIFKYVKKVPPGTFLEINHNKEIQLIRFWDVEMIYENALLDSRSENEIAEDLESILLSAFQLRMVADVEVGIFLSGGIDSSLVTALLQKNNSKQLQTFTIGFEDKQLNEAEIASDVATQLGTRHSVLYCTEDEFKQVIPDMPDIYDEPFGDSSAIPTYLVSKLAAKSVKVALSGDGGDELFGGYSKYKFTRNASSVLHIPYPIRKMLYNLSYKVSPTTVEAMAGKLGLNTYSQISSKYLKFQQTLLARNVEDFFNKSSSYVTDLGLDQLTGFKLLSREQMSSKHIPKNLLSYLGMKDMLSYLPGDILTKVDRASMSVALEAREPFLDPEIINFSFTIPDHLKISQTGESKYILKKILRKYISPELITRPKQGFTVPISKWLMGFLKEELITLQNDKLFFITFSLDQSAFSDMLQSFFLNENKYNPHFIWFVYCLYKWYQKWL